MTTNFNMMMSSLTKIFSAINLQQQRHCLHTTQVLAKKRKFIINGKDITEKYTMKPLEYNKTGGRGPDGKIWTKRIGGGHKQRYRMVDNNRSVAKGTTLEERVYQIRYDPLRTADIAIVASGDKKRYILAGEHMKEGDIIKSHSHIPVVPVLAEPGDSHPVGALPSGTVIHNIEMYAAQGGRLARAAGSAGTIVNHTGNRSIVRMPSGREVSITKECCATVGRPSNVKHNEFVYGSAGRKRWFGIRPRSGKYQKKSGYHGRKIKQQKPMVKYDRPPKVKIEGVYTESL